MGAGGDFRHHAAIGRMFGDLAQDGVGQYLAASHGIRLDHSRSGFVAGAFDPQNAQAGPHERLR